MRLLLFMLLSCAALAGERYPSPVELALSPDAARLYVLCEGTNEVVACDTATRTVTRRIAVGRVPKGLVLSAGARKLYVANSWDDTVSEIDIATARVTRTLRAGYEPTSVAVDKAGRFLYTANRIGGDVSVIDLVSGEETKRLVAGRGASYLAMSPDGAKLHCTHIYPLPGVFRKPPESEVTVIDTARRVVVERVRLSGSAGVFHMAFGARSGVGLAAAMRPKNLIPLAHVAHGWAIGNHLALFGPGLDAAVHVPIDEMERYFPAPFGVALSNDESAAYVSSTGSNTVTAIDFNALLRTARERRGITNDLSAAADYVTARIAVGRAPRGIALTPDGRRLYVANRNDDTVSVVDTATRKSVAAIALGGPRVISAHRRGERLFYDARYSFQGHMGCSSCHIEGTMDGLPWDLEPDGFGIDIVDNRLLENVAATAPFKWNGGNPDLETECGPRTEKFFYRAQSYDRAQLADLVAYVKSIPARPNRYRAPNGELTPAQERGKAIFERARKKNGEPIPASNRCPVCHPAPLFTNRESTDVGTAKHTDRTQLFDVPQLFNVALSAPYLHDGSAQTLEELYTVFNPNDAHGVTNDLRKDELNDLIEYLKTL